MSGRWCLPFAAIRWWSFLIHVDDGIPGNTCIQVNYIETSECIRMKMCDKNGAERR